MKARENAGEILEYNPGHVRAKPSKKSVTAGGAGGGEAVTPRLLLSGALKTGLFRGRRGHLPASSVRFPLRATVVRQRPAEAAKLAWRSASVCRVRLNYVAVDRSVYLFSSMFRFNGASTYLLLN